MEEIKVIKELEKKSEFINWRSDNKVAFLSYIMRIIENPPNNEWQIGYFNKEKDRITTFFLNDDDVKIDSDEEVFKKEEDIVEELQLDKIKFSLVESAKLAQEVQQKKYPNEKPMKIIAILQNLPDLGDIWNFSFVTKNFNTLNIKISANSGKILKHSLTQIFEFK